MIRFYDYFSENYKYTMYSLNYKKIETDKAGNFNLLADDHLTIEKQERHLCCYYTRRLYFEPENIFSIEVTYKILFSINERRDISSLTEQEILESLYHDALESFDQVAAHMSLVVAQTLSSGNHEPIILPPNVLSKDMYPSKE